MPPLTWALDRGRESVLVTVRGRPGPGWVAALSEVLAARLAERPDALLLDVPAPMVTDPGAAGVLAALARRAAASSGVAVLLRRRPADPAPARAGAADHRATLTRSLRTIRSVLTGERGAATSLGDHLLPVAGAGRHARNMATEACARWALPHLVSAAALLTDELVHQAAAHGGSMMAVTLTLHDGALHVVVRHSATAGPAAASPEDLGLVIIDALACWWGYLPLDGDVALCAALPAS